MKQKDPQLNIGIVIEMLTEKAATSSNYILYVLMLDMSKPSTLEIK